MGKTIFERKLQIYNDEDDKMEADMQVIRLLMKGNAQLTEKLAVQLYYRILRENIQFETSVGLDFLDRIMDTLSERQIKRVRSKINEERRKIANREKISRTNKGMVIFTFSAVFAICVIYLNWNIFLDMKTNYDAYQLQERMVEAERAARIEDLWKEKQAQEAILKQIQEEQIALSQAAVYENVQKPQPELLSKFKELYTENSDFRGWLKIDGMKIDYPVMTRPGDNDYYLDKNFEGKKDKNGLLILDYRCDLLSGAQNFIIYGHNMSSGVMFGTLKNYKSKAFCDEHPIIQFDSLYEEAEYKVVAAMLSEVAYADEDLFRYYDAIDMSTEESFNAFYENISEKALYMTGETLAFGDSCLILSTCDRYKEDGRFVVIAKKIQK